MELTAEQPHYNDHELNQEVRHANDTVTWMAEMLYGSMRTSFDFYSDGSVLRSEDYGSMDEVFDDAIEDAQVIASYNPSLLFEVRRRLVESEELDDMKAMINGELYTDDGEQANTIVVLSDFPAELMDATEDVGGYNAGRKQAMLRIITLQEGGGLRITSQSLDGSNRKALGAVGTALGKHFEDGELLSQRINLNCTPEGQEKLPDNLTEIHDDSLAQQFGGTWHAGIRQPDERAYVNTYEFARQQTDLIELFTEAKMADPKSAEALRFNIAAAATARYEQFIAAQSRINIKPGAIDPKAFVKMQVIGNVYRNLRHELMVQGRRAAARGVTFSGCGMTIGAEESFDGSMAGSAAERLGYGNGLTFNANGVCVITSKECPSCKAKDVKTWVSRRGGQVHYKGACGCEA